MILRALRGTVLYIFGDTVPGKKKINNNNIDTKRMIPNPYCVTIQDDKKWG